MDPPRPIQSFAVPDINGKLPNVQPLRVPDVVSGENLQEIPDWTYKKFSVMDIFHSKLGIAATTSMITFMILIYLNPPFVQQSGENIIETKKPSLKSIYFISFAVFLFVFFVSVNPMP